MLVTWDAHMISLYIKINRKFLPTPPAYWNVFWNWFFSCSIMLLLQLLSFSKCFDSCQGVVCHVNNNKSTFPFPLISSFGIAAWYQISTLTYFSIGNSLAWEMIHAIVHEKNIMCSSPAPGSYCYIYYHHSLMSFIMWHKTSNRNPISWD